MPSTLAKKAPIAKRWWSLTLARREVPVMIQLLFFFCSRDLDRRIRLG